jgi:hypothetical protein
MDGVLGKIREREWRWRLRIKVQARTIPKQAPLI